MTRSFSRFTLAEGLAVVGVFFGAWLVHHAFQAAVDTPLYPLLLIGGLDILACFALLGYLLRLRLQAGERLPTSWITVSAVLVAGFLGWISALLLDAERVRAEQRLHRDYSSHLAQIDDAVRQFQQLLPVGGAGGGVDRKRWELIHDRYAHEYDLLRQALRDKSPWDKELASIDDQVQHLHMLGTDAPLARERAQQQIEKLRAEISQGEQDLDTLHRVRWHGIGSAALTGVFLLLGCALLGLVFDRELRRRRKALTRLAAAEANFRSLVEHQPDPVAVLDAAGAIRYANPAWTDAFNYPSDDLLGRPLLDLIHPEDRPPVQVALQQREAGLAIPVRLNAAFGIPHDVEMQCQEHDGANMLAVRFHPVRATPEIPEQPSILKLPDPLHVHDIPALSYLYDPVSRHFSQVSNLPAPLLGHPPVSATGAPEFLASILHPDDEATIFRSLAHRDTARAGTVLDDEMRLRDAGGQYQWFSVFHRAQATGPEQTAKFVGVAMPIRGRQQAEADRAETERKIRTLTDAERQARADADALQRVHAEQQHQQEQGRKNLEKSLRERDQQCKILEADLRAREERARKLETDLRAREERVKKLEGDLRDHDQQREELESTLREHQDRLHDLHLSHERHGASLQASKDAMRRLATGVANDFNKLLSVVLGYTDVLRESLPKDHLAQNYVEEIRQSASHGTELTQKLLAFSRNHLLQMVPVELNRQLDALDGKIRDLLGRNVDLKWEYASQELWVKTDPHPLEQALLHLLAHTRDHLPRGGTLTIRTQRVSLKKSELTHADLAPGSYVEIRLRDHGIDLDDDARTHLFEPYYAGKEGTRSDLSLATANGIIRQSGGCIDVEGPAGAESEIVIRLPWTDERPQLQASA